MLTSSHTPKRYLVTGGCGFIGSHLVDALIAAGNKVVILDNLSTGKLENADPEAELIVGDTTDEMTVESAMEGVDGCFHLAAIASVEKSTLDWAKTHTVNVTSTVNIFQAISRLKKKIPVVYTSSAAVYGNNPHTPLNENEVPVPLTAYGADKLGCDLHACVAWSVHGIPNTGLRPFNVYGSRQDPSSPYSGVISIFTNHICSGQSIRIYGDGHQVRDFVYVDDAVKAFTAAMQHRERLQGHDVFNLCTGRSTSINRLASEIEFVSERRVERHYLPERKGDIRVSIGDPAKLYLHLNVSLNTSLREGLQQMISQNLMQVAA